MSTIEERRIVVDRIKMQAITCNYGLPTNSEMLGLGDNLTPSQARKKIKAIQELWIRLNLFLATGKSSSGKIDYPEARRTIHYGFNGKQPQKSQIIFKAHTKMNK